MSDNTNEIKTCAPGLFGLKASTPGSTMEARFLGHEDAVPALDMVGGRSDAGPVSAAPSSLPRTRVHHVDLIPVWSKYSNAQRVSSLHVSRIDADIEGREAA